MSLYGTLISLVGLLTFLPLAKTQPLCIYNIFVGVFLSWNFEYDSAIALFLSDALKSQV